MEIKTNIEGKKATIEIEGKLTVSTSPDLNQAVEQLPGDVSDIDIELGGVGYVASAGLRVIVAVDKLASSRGGTMRLLHPCDDVMDVLDMTGLAEVLSIVR